MSVTDASPLQGAVDELSELLGADGARLRVVTLDDHAARAELAVEFDGVECEDCVLPPDRLHDTVASVLARRVGRPVGLVLHDPRSTPMVTAAATPTQVVVLDPTGVAPDLGPPDPGPDAGALRGRTIGVRHDILWPSFDWTLDEWGSGFEAAGATILRWRRVQGLVGADLARAQGEYEAMLASSDVVISGLANCGSCTSWSVRDALTAAERGLPTAAVATAHFAPLARHLAADGGRPGLRVIVLPYPYDTLPEAEVRAHARAAFPKVLEVLGARV